MDLLLNPYRMGNFYLKNRVVMCPLTRCRAEQPYNNPSDLNALYYSQRASSGLIITEGSQISPQGQGILYTPGIYSKKQIEGWGKVAQAVHAKKGIIFLQLWHVGRVSHSFFQPNGEPPVAPSSIAVKKKIKILDEKGTPYLVDCDIPRPLEKQEINLIINDFAQGAKNALNAGMDGVEIHGANGYLIEQFLSSNTNKRNDQYGGSMKNRLRFLIEILEAIIKMIGCPEKVGLRLSPGSRFNDIDHKESEALYSYLIETLNHYNLAYLHLIEPHISGNMNLKNIEKEKKALIDTLSSLYKGTVIRSGGYSKERGEKTIREKKTNLVGFGRLFIANPDLPERFKNNSPLNIPNVSTFYEGGEKGYIDYPFLNKEKDPLYFL